MQLLHTPDGVRDIYGTECKKRLCTAEKIFGRITCYGYEPIVTPTFEFFDVFSAERGSVPSKEMYKFFDREGNTLVLRPDITPSIARCAARYFRDETSPIRLCYSENTFINAMELRGSLKETRQIGAELINDDSVEADAEMLAMVVDCLKTAGLSNFRVEIGVAEFFKALADEAKLDPDETELLRASILEKNTFGMEDVLENKGVKGETREALLKLPELFGNIGTLSEVRKITSNPRALSALDRIEKLFDLLKPYGCQEYITYDLGALSKYEYYTGITFSAFTYGTGNPVVTGGRYDNLVGQFGKKASAIGFAFLLDELMAALSRQNIECEIPEAPMVIKYSRDNYAEAVEMACGLRNRGKVCVLKQED